MTDFLRDGERPTESGATLPGVRQRNWRDVMLFSTVLMLGAVALGQMVTTVVPPAIGIAAMLALMLLAGAVFYRRMVRRADHARAAQLESMLKIANESISYLRQGLNTAIAREVCLIVLRHTEAAAVSITDRDGVLGFVGVGEDHHLAGGPIMTRATREALEHGELRILRAKAEIGCPEEACRLRAAIVVPLKMREHPVGALKFYYTSGNRLDEMQLAMAEGLARLLSTQLELSEVDRQTELATKMELKALQAQINPHFLFNTINTIAAFTRTDPLKARHLLRQFGAFYRRTLEQTDGMVSLEQELEFVKMYVELEKARFGDRLEVRFEIAEQARERMLPAFVVQPLVENSVGHGMRSNGSPLAVCVSAFLCDSVLHIDVEDDGEGIDPERMPHIYEPLTGKGLGIALKNVRDRLQGHFGTASSLSIESESGKGTIARLTISSGL
ncbi:MAG: histidine kinase [Coriobacteriia bacterium]|nr:histidine kinase [Coriobacteriia bacterium]